MSTFAEAQAAYNEAATAEKSALDTLNSAKANYDKVLLLASRENVPADDKRITDASTAMATADTAMAMAALRRSDAEATMHLCEIAELTAQSVALVKAHAGSVQAAKDAASHARQSLEAAQKALDDYWTALSAVSQATHDGSNFDLFVAARSASNPTLAAIPAPDRPKTRLQAHGSNGQRFEVALIGPTGARVSPRVFN